jgi:hypothetical protein
MKPKTKRVYRSKKNDIAEIIKAFASLARSMKGYSAGQMALLLSIIPFTVGVVWMIISPSSISYTIIAFSIVMALIGAYLEHHKTKNNFNKVKT